MTGFQFGKLTVIKNIQAPKDKPKDKKYWLCKCSCGGTTILSTSEINRKNRRVQSCGKCSVNTYDLSGEYGIGYTSKGESFYFDLEDYDLLKTYSWSKTKSGYLLAYVKESNKKYVYMHRLILGLTDDSNFDVDHQNHNTSDNKKENLRICTHQENIMNSTLAQNNKSGITGVRFDLNTNKWISNIAYNYKTIYLGSFPDFEDAVKARKEAEEKYFGEYAYKERN